MRLAQLILFFVIVVGAAFAAWQFYAAPLRTPEPGAVWMAFRGTFPAGANLRAESTYTSDSNQCLSSFYSSVTRDKKTYKEDIAFQNNEYSFSFPQKIRVGRCTYSSPFIRFYDGESRLFDVALMQVPRYVNAESPVSLLCSSDKALEFQGMYCVDDPAAPGGFFSRENDLSARVRFEETGENQEAVINIRFAPPAPQ